MLINNPREIRENLQGDTTILNPVTRAGVGGLNLVDGALTTPLTDAMVARNVVVGNDGVLRRRPGTARVQTLATQTLVGAPNRTTLTSVTTARGHDFLIFRVGRAVGARHIRQRSTGPTLRVGPSFEVLRSGGGSEGNFVVLRDPRIRVLLFTPDNPTVEIRVNEVRLAQTPTSGNTIVVPRADLEQLVPGVYEQQDIVVQQLNVMVSGQRVNITGMTYDANNVTITTEFTFDGLQVVDVQLFQSYWWAEAEMFYGDRFSDVVTRTNLTEDDLHVPVPSNLRDGLEQRGTDSFDPYTLDAMYWDGAEYNFYSQVDDGLPTTALEFAMSDGSPRRDNSPVVPSPLFLTYGNYEPGVVRPVTLTRHRRLNTRGGNGSTGADLEVFLDDRRLPYVGTTGDAPFASYRMWDATDENQITNLNVRGQFISLDGQWRSRPQVNPSSVVKVVEFNNPYAPLNMTRVPCYGLSEICDYGQGSFPTTGATYQNRLVIAGMPHDPLLVAFSALYDSRTPQEPYMYFQNDPLDLAPESGPFQVRLDSTADDRIISLQEFQGSLFIITYRAVFRIAAAGRAVITASNYFVSSVSSIGAVNTNAIARPEGGIAFLSPRGVFAIVNGVQSNEATEYRLIELSTKISPIFDPTLTKNGLNRLWWMSYATDERRLYVGISDRNDLYHASELYTYDLVNEAWSTMDTVGGFRTWQGIDIALERDTNQHYIICDIFTDGTYSLIATGQKHHLDYQRSGLNADEVLNPNARETETPRHPITTVQTINRHPSLPNVRGSIYKVLAPMSPLTQVRDIEVTLGGVTLEPVTDYVKLPGNYIQLLNPPVGDSQQLVVTSLAPRTFDLEPTVHHLGLVSETLPDTHHVFSQFINQTNKDQYNRWFWVREFQQYDWTIGVMFQSVWVSPVYTLGQITQHKRLSAVTLYSERVRNRDHWFGTNETYNAEQWPQVSVPNFAGTEDYSTDASIDRHDAYIGVLTNQETDHTHPLSLGGERDFFDMDEGTYPGPLELSDGLASRPGPLQVPDGVATRRTFTDTVSVFQLIITSIGQQPFGVSAIQVEADLNPSKYVHKSR